MPNATNGQRRVPAHRGSSPLLTVQRSPVLEQDTMQPWIRKPRKKERNSMTEEELAEYNAQEEAYAAFALRALACVERTKDGECHRSAEPSLECRRTALFQPIPQ
jgi:hypothetical protein